MRTTCAALGIFPVGFMGPQSCIHNLKQNAQAHVKLAVQGLGQLACLCVCGDTGNK